jgi:choline kinase
MALRAGLSAIILAAGAGSRLRDVADLKPLAEVAGRPLLIHALHSLAAAGVESATIVTGREAPRIDAALKAAPIPVETVFNPAWASKPNGVSVLAARDRLGARTVLMMADHLVEPALVVRLLERAPASGLSLAVDRRLGSPWVDEADVTRVRTDGHGRITGIGKDLLVYDCHDTGVFLVNEALMEALASLPSPGLSDGVRRLARDGAAHGVDIGDAFWFDVDDARALAMAEVLWRG